MTISTSPSTVTLKGKTSQVVVGSKLARINQFEIPGAGEYNVGDVALVHLYVGSADVSVVRLEDLVIVSTSLANEEVARHEETQGAQILVANVDAESDLAGVQTCLKMLDPRYLVLTGEARHYVQEKLALPTESNGVKVTAAGLAESGTLLIAD